jgi:SAM-dependent methyltransferase
MPRRKGQSAGIPRPGARKAVETASHLAADLLSSGMGTGACSKSTAPSDESSMAAYYARRAQEYERIFQKPERQADLHFLRAFVEQTFLAGHVLEVASGTGYWTEVLSRSAASVTATDLNEEVLNIARGKPLDKGKVVFQQADAYALPAFPKLFTAGLAGFWWSHVPKGRLGNFLAMLHQKFAPGATIVFIDNRFVEGSSTPISRMDSEGNTYQIRQLDDGSRHEVLKNFPSERELGEAVNRCALEIQIQFLEYYWSLRYVVGKGKADLKFAQS